MIEFWIIAAIMITGVVLLLIRPLLGTARAEDLEERNRLNIDIYKQRQQELEKDLQDGQIDQQSYDVATRELEMQLASDIPNQTESTSARTSSSHGIDRWLLVLLIPMLTVGLYLYLGKPEVLDQEETPTRTVRMQDGTEQPVPSVEEMIGQLEQRVNDQPDDTRALQLLTRAYLHVENFEKAEQALARLLEQVDDDPNLWADYADIGAVNRDGQLAGEPYTAIKRALSLQPRHPKSLWLAGTYHFQQAEYEKAIRFWTLLRDMLPPESEDVQAINQNINTAREKLGLPPLAEAPAASEPVAENGLSVKGQVSIAADLQADVSPEDTVFVTAKAVSGPRMPLAVVRKPVSELPFEFTLNDAMAMMPQLKMSGFDQVVISARISKSGNAIPASGDLVSNEVTVKPGHADSIKLVIDKKIP